MPQLDYELMCQGIVNDIRARAPKVTRNLVRHTTFIAMKTGNMIGKITLDTNYANFVNYGYLTHPRSYKLKSDYMFVEKTINNQLKNLVFKYGGGYVKYRK